MGCHIRNSVHEWSKRCAGKCVCTKAVVNSTIYLCIPRYVYIHGRHISSTYYGKSSSLTLLQYPAVQSGVIPGSMHTYNCNSLHSRRDYNTPRQYLPLRSIRPEPVTSRNVNGLAFIVQRS